MKFLKKKQHIIFQNIMFINLEEGNGFAYIEVRLQQDACDLINMETQRGINYRKSSAVNDM